MRTTIVSIMLAAIIIAIAVWRTDGAAPHEEPASPAAEVTPASPAVAVPSPPGSRVRPAPPRPSLAPARPGGSRAAFIKNAAPPDPALAKGRDLAEQQWKKFVDGAQPTEAQQRAIFAAIYDGQLYLREVRKVQSDWHTEQTQREHRGADPRAQTEEEGPYPLIDWAGEIDESVAEVAKAVLSPQQYETYRYTFRLAASSAVMSEFVVPEPAAR